jgi:hypothetical protein
MVTHKYDGKQTIYATTKTREKAESVAASLAERMPEELYKIEVIEE